MDAMEKMGMDRENPCSATPPRRGHTYVPWVPGMWNGDEGRQTMKVTNHRDAECGFKRFSERGREMELYKVFRTDAWRPSSEGVVS